jgi:hypothetical protein
MSKNSLLKDIRANAAWDGIKFLLQLVGSLISTSVFAAFLHLFTVVSLNWVIIIGLFLLSFLLIVTTYLLSIWQKDLIQTSPVEIAETHEPQFIFNDAPLIDIRNRKYTNEKIILDGHSYTDCMFTNVKFVYNGTAPFRFTHNEVYGMPNISSGNPSVLMSFYLMEGFGLTKEGILLRGENEKLLDNIKRPETNK